MKPKAMRVCSAAIGALLVLVVITLSPKPAQVDAQTRLTPAPPRLTPLRITPLPSTPATLLRVTPVTPTEPCVYLTTDGAPGASFVGGRIAERCFAFPGDAGTVASIRLTAPPRNATPRMDLRGPDGQVIAASSTGKITNQALDLDGPYAVVVSGAGLPRSIRIEVAVIIEGATPSLSTNSVAASLCGGTVLPNLPVTGMAPYPGENCLYTFVGQQGQSVALRMDRLTPDLAPNLILLAPNGDTLDTSHALSADAVYVSALDLPTTGVYTAVAGSVADQSAGAFTLALRPVQAARCGDSLTFGQLAELELPAGRAACELWLDVTESRVLAASVTALDGASAPSWQITSPQKTVVATDQDSTWYAEDIGPYELRLEPVDGQPSRLLIQVGPPLYVPIHIVTSCGANLIYGQSTGSIAHQIRNAGTSCLFNFNGAAGDLVWVAVSRDASATAFDPVVELMPPGYSAASAPESTAYSGQVPGMTVLRDHPLARNGRYTVRVSDYGNDDAGGFYIMVWRRTPIN